MHRPVSSYINMLLAMEIKPAWKLHLIVHILKKAKENIL